MADFMLDGADSVTEHLSAYAYQNAMRKIAELVREYLNNYIQVQVGKRNRMSRDRLLKLEEARTKSKRHLAHLKANIRIGECHSGDLIYTTFMAVIGDRIIELTASLKEIADAKDRRRAELVIEDYQGFDRVTSALTLDDWPEKLP